MIVCTVTYLPLGNHNFVLTSNRDETPTRAAIELRHNDDKKLLYPREPKAGGTWICASAAERLVCLLNGAFEKHQHRPPYRRSRGLVVLDFFEYENAAQFLQMYDFQGIEPFTMVIWERGALAELRWDEEQAHFRQLNPNEPHIWSSSPLYPQPVRAMRASWFADWQAQHAGNWSAADILQFHQTAGTGDPENDVKMYRRNGIVQTISITQVIYQQNIGFDMSYRDLIDGQQHAAQLAI